MGVVPCVLRGRHYQFDEQGTVPARYHELMASAKKTPLAPAKSRKTLSAPDEPAARVLRRFRLVFNAVKTHFREVEKKAGVAGAQLWALSVIRDRPGLNMTDLAHAMDVHQSTASNLVKTLIERELVAGQKEGADRRTVQLHLLPAGAKVLRRAPGPFTGVLPAALANMDPGTLARLDKDLGELIAALGADRRGAGIPLGQP
jgi:DNA-binding MarR family transcriptional regulator